MLFGGEVVVWMGKAVSDQETGSSSIAEGMKVLGAGRVPLCLHSEHKTACLEHQIPLRFATSRFQLVKKYLRYTFHSNTPKGYQLRLCLRSAERLFSLLEESRLWLRSLDLECRRDELYLLSPFSRL